MAGIPVGTLPQFLLICSCFIAVSEAFTCFSVSDCRGDVVRGVGRPGDCCARSGLSFLTPDEGCTNCFREEAFVGEGSTLYLGFFSNFNPGQFFTRADIRLLVGVSENRDVQFTVETRGQVTTYTATRTSPAEVDLDTNLRIDDIRTRGNGIFVRSLQGEALSVVALASEFTSADTFKVLPSVYLPDVGYEYYAVSVPRMNVFEDYEYDEPEPLDPLGDSTFVIVATEDETIITLSLTQTVDISNAPDLVTQIGGNTIQAGNLETVVLNRLQTLLISSENDLSSSRVWSDKPISLISGHECGNLPDNLLFCDQLVEQIPPTSTWGTRFITAPIANRTQYDIFKVIASRNGTTVRRVCNVGGQSSPITLARGQITDLQIFSNQSCYFESDNPVLLVQFSVSSEVDGTTNADPFMVVIPPVEQYRTNYTINTFQSTATSGTNFINILVPAPVSNTNIRINGTLIGATFTAIHCVNTEGICAYAAQMSVPPGTHFITHENPQVAFSIITYWLSFRVGHGHFGGAMQRPIALPQVTLQSAMMELYESNVSANFTLTRSGDTRVRAVVSVRTRQLTSENAAIAGVDYIPRNITVVFSPGETTQEFRVLLGPDDIFPAPNKTFEVYLASSPGIYLSPFTYTMVTILNDDPDLPVMNISFTRTVINVREGVGVVEFVLRKTPGAVGPVSVLLRTHEGTARAEEDYTHLEERVEFGIEDLEKRVMVLIADNDILENVELFTATIVPIRGPFPVAVQNDNVTVIIRDNDFAVIGFTPVLYTVEEGRRSLSVNVTHQIGALGRTVTLSVFTVDGSATAGSDFTQVSQEVVFSGNAGTSQLVSIAITDDNVVEMLESFRVELQFGPEEVETDNILLIPNEATVTITDNDIADIGLDIARRTVMEGEGSLQVTVRVLGDRQLDSPVTVGLSTVSLNATAGDDFQSVVNLPLVLSTGEQQSQQASIDIVDDRIRDDREMFRVLISLLSSNGRARIPTANASADILIMDNDPPNTVQCFVEAESCGGVGFQAQSVGDCCTILSGTSFRMTAGTELCQTCLLIGFEQDLYTLSERAAPYSLSVTTVRGFLPQDLVLGVSAIPDTASASDYQLASSRIVLTRNSPNATVQVTIPQETLRTDAPFETFRLVLNDALGIAPSNLFFRDTNIIIQDVDVLVEFDPTSYTVLESGRYANITVVKRGQTTQTVSVSFTTADGTATAVQDYVTTSQRVTFPPTVTSQTVMVSIVDDNAVESMEQFTALLSVPGGQSGVGLGVDTATVNIIDADEVTIGFDATAYTFTETDDTVSRSVSVSVQSGSLARDVVVTVQTVDGTATAPSDYTTVSMDLTFNSGTTTQTMMIPIIGDNVVESTESFTVSLTSADSAVTLSPSTTTVTIQDDDVEIIGFDATAYTFTETDSTVSRSVSVSVQSGSLARDIVVTVQTMDGTATASSDYMTVSMDLTFNSGNTTQTMMIPIVGDNVVESTESFSVSLTSADNAVTLSPSTTTVTIQDDDKVTIGFDATAYTFTETDSTVSRSVSVSVQSGSLARDVVVTVQTVDGTATAPSDYMTVSMDLTFNSGTTTQTMMIPIVGDNVVESTESFSVSLTSADSAVTLSPSTTTVTIEDDDDVEIIGFDATAYLFIETNSTVSRSVSVSVQSGSLARDIVVTVQTMDGSATASSDYTSVTRGLTFNSGTTTQTVMVPIVGDNVVESTESFTVSLTSADSAVTLSPSTTTVTILDDDDDSSALIQSCHDATGCGGNVVTGVSTARTCCLGSGLSFQNADGTCRQCIVHGFNQTTDLVLTEGATQEVIRMTLDIKGSTITEPGSTRVLNFGFSFTCIDSSNGGGPQAVDRSDYTDTGCGSNIQLRLFPSAQRRSEVGINAVADDKIEGNEVLILKLVLTSATQTAINNAGNIFFQDTLNIRVIDLTDVVIGFSDDSYTGDEGEPEDASRPNIPCTVTVEIIQRSLEIPLQIRLTPGEQNATRRDFNDTVIVAEFPATQTLLVQAIQIFDDEINEVQEIFNVSLEVVSNISNTVQYRIQTTLCRIRQSDPIEIGFTQRRIFHIEEFRTFDTLINKSRASEQTFTAQVEISTLNSPFGQSATRGEDFQTGLPGLSTVLVRLRPSEPNVTFSYRIIGDNSPENQEVFQLSITPAIGSPTFTCTQANGCFQQLEIVIVNDDVVVVGFVDTLVEVNETDGQATLNVSITQPLLMPGFPLRIMFSLRVNSMDDSAASHSAIDTLRNPMPGVEDFPQIVDGSYYTFQEMPFDILEFRVLNQMFNGTHRSQTFSFPIFVDDVPEGVEELQLTLSLQPDDQLPEGAVNVTPSVGTVRIHDFSSVVVGFERRTYTVNEGDGQVELCVNITVPRRQDIGTVTFILTVETQNGSAVSPDDYASVSMILHTFTSQRPRQCFNVSIMNDVNIEITETFTARLTLIPASVTTITANRIIVDPPEATVQVINNVLNVVIGFSEDSYIGDEGEPGDVSRPNTPCTVTIEIFERSLEIPLQIRLTPGEGTATRRDFNDTVIVTEVSAEQTLLVQAIQIFDDEINEGREVFNVSLEVVGNISTMVTYRIQTTLCRIRQSDPIEIGFTQRRIFHTEEFRIFETLINKSRASEQTFTAQVEISTLNSPFGQSATRGEDFQTFGAPGLSTVLVRLAPSQPNRFFSYQILGDNTPENQEVFQLSVTPDIGSPTFTCTQANGCFQQLEVVIVDDDVVVVGFVETLVEVNETDGQATLNVSISSPAPNPALAFEIMFSLNVNSMDGSAASHSAIDTLRNPMPGVEDFPQIVDGAYYTFQEMPFDILEFRVLNQMFNATQRSQTFTFPIFVDDVPEGVEELNLTMSLRPNDQLPTGSVNVTPAVGTVRIHDSSSMVVGFERRIYTVAEADGQVELCVNITVPRRQDIGTVSFNLNVETQDGTAVASGDYTSVSMTLGPFTSQQPRQCFNVSIINDTIVESNETFTSRLTLLPASVTTISPDRIIIDPPETTVQITDNDLLPPPTTTTMYTNEGNEFFVGFMENPQLLPSPSDDSFFISTNQTERVVSVNVTIRGGRARVLQAAAAVTNTLSIPSSETRTPPQGIHILAPDSSELTVFGSNEEFISVDGFLALPCPRLPVELYNYYAISVPPTTAGFSLIASDSAMLIVSCNNDTRVTFTPTQTITDPQNSDSTISAGTNTTVTLAEAQPLYIQGRSDLTGTRIVSNQPISFFSGHECAYRPPTQGSQCDHIVEQIPPTVTWGRIFLTAPSSDRTTGDIFKIVTSQESTGINVTCVNRAAPLDIPLMPNYTVALEAAGNSWNFTASASDYCSIEADKPILVAQIGIGDANTGVDTYMTLVPAVSQYRNNIRFSVVGNPGLRHWTNMFVIPAYFEPANITVDGVQGSLEDWVAIRCSNGGVCGYGRQIMLGGSRLKLVRHDNPEASLGVIVYGSATQSEAYGYPGGLKLSVNDNTVS